MPYALDPSALGLVSSGILCPASGLNAGGALGHGNCASAAYVCARGQQGALHRACEDDGMCVRGRRGTLHYVCEDDKGRHTMHTRTVRGATSWVGGPRGASHRAQEDHEGPHTVRGRSRRTTRHATPCTRGPRGALHHVREDDEGQYSTLEL